MKKTSDMVDISRIRLKKKGMESFLSPLESEVLTVLWSNEQMRVREIYEKLKDKRSVALTSIAVILDRLHKKKIVKRQIESGRGGNHYIYAVQKTKADFEATVLDATVNKLIDNFGSVAVNYFNERFSKGK